MKKHIYFLLVLITLSIQCKRERPAIQPIEIAQTETQTPDSTEKLSPTSESENKTAQSQLPARVIRIIDGDTVEVMYYDLPVMVRLAHIDCPEKRGSQPFGNTAKTRLSDLIFAKNILLDFTGERDRNGRYVCEIYTQDGVNINKEMMKLGLAWHFTRYSSDPEYAELEQVARAQKVGLWQDPNPVAPWDWRK